MATVLVLDGQQRKSLALTRWLAADGHRVLTAETTWVSISRFSRYAARSYVYPSPLNDREAFVAWLRRLLEREPIDAVLPTDDDTTAALIGHERRLDGHTGLLLPPGASFAAMRDKGCSAQWFQRLGLAHPPTIVVRQPGDVQRAVRELGLPLVIKPRITSGSRGMRFVYREHELDQTYRAVHRTHPWPVIQKFIPPGPKYHVCFLHNRQGVPIARYVQRELRQYPIRGGPSTMQEAVDRPDLLALVAPLFAALPWAGPVHADVMEDGRTGQPYILEVNPRYWSSLHVAHRAGLNFARAHLAVALGRDVAPLAPANPGARGRSLLPFDILAYLSDPQRSRWQPAFFSRYGANTWDDLLSWSDPGPTLGFWLAALRFMFDRSMWRAVLRTDVR